MQQAGGGPGVVKTPEHLWVQVATPLWVKGVWGQGESTQRETKYEMIMRGVCCMPCELMILTCLQIDSLPYTLRDTRAENVNMGAR